METLEIETTKRILIQEKPLYDEDGYLIASLEEGLAEERAGLGRSFASWDEMIKTLQWEIDNDI